MYKCYENQKKKLWNNLDKEILENSLLPHENYSDVYLIFQTWFYIGWENIFESTFSLVPTYIVIHLPVARFGKSKVYLWVQYRTLSYHHYHRIVVEFIMKLFYVQNFQSLLKIIFISMKIHITILFAYWKHVNFLVPAKRILFG